MAATSKAQKLTEVYTLLRNRYKLEPREDRLSVLEAIIYGICHESTTREQAHQALSRFKDSFFDWNEVRVSSIDEIQGVLAGLPDPVGRARRIRRFLQELFESIYSFSLDDLQKKPQKESIKVLQEYKALQSDYVLATVIQQALGGHAIPVDEPARRCLERLGLADPDMELPALRASLERAIPKNRGIEFTDLLEELAHDTCVEEDPDCARCELKEICPTGQERLASPGKPAATKSAAKASPSPKASAKSETPQSSQGRTPRPK